MENTRLVRFDETTLIDFQEVILPNVLMDLYGVEDFAEHGVVALGVLQGEEALGALIARMNDEAVLHILSIYVQPELRRQKIGSMLLDGLALTGFEMFDSPQNTEIAYDLSVDYVMPEELAEGFEAFLDKNGFKHRESRDPVYVLTASAREGLTDCGGGHEIPAEFLDIVNEMAEDSDINSDAQLSAYAGSETEANCVLQLIDAGDGTYDLVSGEPEHAATDAEFESALKLLLGKIDADATVYASGEKNVHCPVLEKAATTVLRRTVMQRRLLVEKGME